MHADESGIDEILRLVIGGAFTAFDVPGYGFLEKAYGNTSAAERRKAGLAGEHHRGLTIAHDGVAVGK